MNNQMLHVFRNTPFGREMLLSSACFARHAGVDLAVYVPRHPQFLFYFDRGIATVELDRSYLRDPATAEEHATAILDAAGVRHSFHQPKRFTASTLPDLPTDWAYMCCPRSMGDLSTKVSLGYVGPRVRAIIEGAPFPILLPPPVFKEWRSLACFFGGSANAVNALACARDLQRSSGLPLQVFTKTTGKPGQREHYQEQLEAANLYEPIASGEWQWTVFETKDLRPYLYEVPHDALVIAGAHGHSVGRELLFGSKMETLQTILPNPLLIVGSACSASANRA